ncbi:hypothetical protein [Paraburkholderia dipogonis]|uniref:hypothetical protein n=1 Tax=Paraburkholderia dipogonis TaxID=1211383 RepID=UPI0038BBAEE8
MGSLDDLIQRGACQIIQQTTEAELATLLEQCDNVKTCGDKRAVARTGHLPRRAVITPISTGPAKVCNRSGPSSTFNSMLPDMK